MIVHDTPELAFPGLRLVERALDAAASGPADIQRIAISLGPGSYTGIRAALAVGQGWALARPVELTALSADRLLAEQCRTRGDRGLWHVVIDAQRNEFYTATYELGEATANLQTPLRIIPRSELDLLATSTAQFVGPQITRAVPRGHDMEPGAGMLARLSAGKVELATAAHLEPIYLRATSFVKAATRGP